LLQETIESSRELRRKLLVPTKNKFALTPQSSSELGELFGCGKLRPPPSRKENGPSREGSHVEIRTQYFDKNAKRVQLMRIINQNNKSTDEEQSWKRRRKKKKIKCLKG
jgi:hypothetical protein